MKNCTIAIPIEDAKGPSHYRAQGIPVAWPALMGYNRQLTDFDLKVPSGAQLATIVIDKKSFFERLDRPRKNQLTLERWETTNQLELHPDLQQGLIDQLSQQIQRGKHGWNPEEPDQLIDTVIQCFEKPKARTRLIAKREARHQAAIDLLHWCSKHPKRIVSVEELSGELFQSRTSLFKGSREHFERTPLELVRSVRMDRVRQLLMSPTLRATKGVTGVVDSAASMGFISRSHFARRYKEHYGEQPIDTLANSLQDKT